MIERQTRWGREETGLLLAGMAGLTVAAVLACSGDDGASDAEPTASAGAASGGSAGTTASAGATSGGSAGTTSGVTASCQSDTTTADNTAAVVAAADALVDALTTEQQTAIQYEKTLANAAQWSNFPTTFVTRNGVAIGDMSTDAQAAAVALAEVAAGATGAALLEELRAADEFLVTDGQASSTDYGAGLYYYSIHGTPSTSSAWMLQIAGHHQAYNFTYGGKCTSATPLFDGVEPTTWTDTDGNAHAPLEAQRAAMVALLTSIGSLSGATLSGTFSDLVNRPAGGGPGGGGGGDTRYPAGLTYLAAALAAGWLLERVTALPNPTARPLAWLEAHPIPLLAALAVAALVARVADRSSTPATASAHAGGLSLSRPAAKPSPRAPRATVATTSTARSAPVPARAEDSAPP